MAKYSYNELKVAAAEGRRIGGYRGKNVFSCSKWKYDALKNKDAFYVLYDENRQEEAILLAKDFRKKGNNTELVLKRAEKSLEEYIACAKRNLCISMLYLRDTNEIEMVNLITGKSNSISKKIK